ncbi:hypothetical protein CHS0354_017368 [Potamilus streckersoni]|uniref:Uncharacterized protein n=1 Tax=Potamilus streckersoni TaxID=2493646 RepID=A0AAE0T4G6_9BIVA|nr:hypothetical protein CHS0354_017368 [Potamilus streckersoni]
MHIAAVYLNEQFIITWLSLWIHKIIPSTAYMIELETTLSRFPKKLIVCGSVNYVVEKRHYPGSDLPKYVFVAFKLPKQRNALQPQTQNKHIFTSISLSRIHIRINFRQYLERELECNFAVDTRKYSHAYIILMEATQKYNDVDIGTPMSPNIPNVSKTLLPTSKSDERSL